MAEHTSKRVATVYAEALYSAAGGAEAAAAVRGDVESLQATLREYPAFAQILGAPEIDGPNRDKIIRKTFEGRVGALTLNFLLVLNQRWRMGSLPAILDAYIAMDDTKRLGRQEVQVISAATLDEGMQARIREGIKAWGGFEPVLQIKQDPSVLGGLVVQIGDRKIDASVQGQLERFREQLKKEFQAKVTTPA